MTNVVFVLPHGSKNNKCYTWSVLVLPHAFKNVHFMRCMLVLPRGLKNNECYMSSTLVSPHGFRNDIYFICSPLVFPHGWEIFSLSLANWSAGSPINSCQDELPPSDPMKSFGQLLQTPPPLCSCQPLTSSTTDQVPWPHFWFWSQLDSICLLVKTTRLRLGVLDICVGGEL